jgi:F0F1-type ATP synthase assembly protein I
MNTFDINKIWDSGADKARNHYDSVKDNVEKMARKKSDNILHKVKRKLIIELIASIIFIILVGVGIYHFSEKVVYPFIVLVLVAFFLSLRLFVKLFRDINRVKEKSVVASLEKTIVIIRYYIRQSKILVYVLTPVGFIVGFLSRVIADGIDFTTHNLLVMGGVILVVGVPFVVGMIWLVNKKYYKIMYEKHLDELESILSNLRNDLKENPD